MTLTYELGLGILNMHLNPKNEVSRSRLSKVRAGTKQTDIHRETDRLTDATEITYHPHSRVAENLSVLFVLTENVDIYSFLNVDQDHVTNIYIGHTRHFILNFLLYYQLRSGWYYFLSHQSIRACVSVCVCLSVCVYVCVSVLFVL